MAIQVRPGDIKRREFQTVAAIALDKQAEAIGVLQAKVAHLWKVQDAQEQQWATWRGRLRWLLKGQA